MSAIRHTKPARIIASLLTLAVLGAFVLTALVPTGFMPEFKGDGSYELVICSGAGTKTVTVQGDTPDGNPDHDEKPSVCAYQALASSQSVEPAFPAFLPAPVIALGQAFFAQDRIVSQDLSFSFTARGPPTV